MTKLEKPGCIIALEYEWKFNYVKEGKIILSNKIEYKKHGLFQIGFKKQCNDSPSTLFFVASNLHKIGLKVERVSSFSAQNVHDCLKGEDTQMDLKFGKKKLQLFTARPFLMLGPVWTTFKVTVYLTEVKKNYKIHQMDGLLSQQLLSSTQNVDVDFNLIAKNGKRFPVHKWMLAARSPVFEALFSEDENDAIVDCNEDVLNQFIRFIYTGEFNGFVSQELKQLAVQYEIKTLEDLCQNASKEVSLDAINRVVAQYLEPGSSETDCVFPVSDTNLIMREEQTNVSIFTFTWELRQPITEKYCEANGPNSGSEKKIATSEAFDYGEEKLFQVEHLVWQQQSYQDTITLKFLSYNHQHVKWVIQTMTCIFNQKGTVRTINPFHPQPEGRWIELPEKPTVSISYPLLATFYVKMRSTVPNFTNKLVDSTFGEQLWTASVNRKMTDVEFLVREESFGAHRSLLSARSPVFASMFASGMKETKTGKVCIEDVDPTTFQSFLKFLYTGTFEPSSTDQDLFEVADKYQVETLMELCRPTTEVVE